MRSLLVTLVSDQTIPNVLCVDYFKPDAILFVTTEKMEEKHKIRATLGSLELVFNERRYTADSNAFILKVKEDSVSDVMQKLSIWINREGLKYDKFIVNITLGTKLMSIGAFEAFRRYAKTDKFVYMPLGANSIELIDCPHESISIEDKSGSSIHAIRYPIKKRLSAPEYCKAYDIDLNTISAKDRAIEDYGFVKWIINGYFGEKFGDDTVVEHLLSNFFSKLRSYRNEKSKKNKLKRGQLPFEFVYKLNHNDKDDLEIINQFFRFDSIKKYLCISEIIQKEDGTEVHISGNIDKEIVDFLTGGWLEEFCFNEVNELKKLGFVDDIALNPTLGEGGAPNEIDVMFTAFNNIYLIECKSLKQTSDKNSDILYKIYSVQDNKVGGLAAKSFLMSTAKANILDSSDQNDADKKLSDYKIKADLLKRAKELKIIVIHPAFIKDLKDILKEEIDKSCDLCICL